MPSSGSALKQLRFELVPFSTKTLHELLCDLGYLSSELASCDIYLEMDLCVEILGLSIKERHYCL